MPISRRLFIRVGTFAAIAAGMSMRPNTVVIGQDTVEKRGAPTQNDPLSYYTMATFSQYVNSVFTLRTFTTVEVTLTKVEDTLPANTSRAGGRESFALLFRGGSVSLPQDTYIVEHPALGTFKLFLVPSGTDENGAQGYVATINRLGYTAKPGPPLKPSPLKKSSPTNPTRSIGAPAPSTETPAPEGKPTRKSKPESPELEQNLINF